MLVIKDFEPLRAKYSQNKNKKTLKLHTCKNTGGFLDTKAGICYHLYYAYDVCVLMSKNEATGMWYLDSNRYESDSYGCDYNGPDHSKILKLDRKANNIQSFALIQTTRFKEIEQLFPYSYPHL